MKVGDLARADHLHHAYIVTGGAEAAVTEVKAMLVARKVVLRGNADVLELKYSDLAVDDARTIARYAFLKSVSDHKYFIIQFDKANDAAQNALLKVVEEAPGNTIFFFCTESLGYVLPTLRSRAVAVTTSNARDEGTEERADALEFLNLSYADRLAKVEKMIAAATRNEDRAPLRNFVRSLTDAAHQKHLPPAALRTLLDADRYLRLNGSSPKVVLSHVAVTLPVI